MPKSKFIQIHFLHSYSSVLLNRDMTGQAKRMPYGGTVRTRVSSQCLKRHWRTADGDYSLFSIPGTTESVRSRDIINILITNPLREEGAYEEDVINSLEHALNFAVYGKNGTTKDKRQPIILGLPEVEYFKAKALEILQAHPTDHEAVHQAVLDLFDAEAQNFAAMWAATQLPAGLVSALCGRMMTSDRMSSIDGSIHVAQSITTHSQESERDYFSVVEELGEVDDETGSAFLGDTELTSGIFYGYVVVDIPQLVSNLQGVHPTLWESSDRTLAAYVVKHLLHLIAKTSPGAKLGSTAPHSKARFMIVEIGSSQPCGYHGAFRDDLKPSMADTLQALAQEVTAQDENYGLTNGRAFMSLEPDPGIPSAQKFNMDNLADWTFQAVLDAQVA